MSANMHEPEWDAEMDRGPYRWQRSLLGRRAGSERLGASLFDIPPGAATFPFHAHHANEELLLVLRGTPSLRTPEGERTLAEGEVVAFPAGRAGAHAISQPVGRDGADRDRVDDDRARHQRVPRLRHALGAQLRTGLRAAR